MWRRGVETDVMYVHYVRNLYSTLFHQLIPSSTWGVPYVLDVLFSTVLSRGLSKSPRNSRYSTVGLLAEHKTNNIGNLPPPARIVLYAAPKRCLSNFSLFPHSLIRQSISRIFNYGGFSPNRPHCTIEFRLRKSSAQLS